MLKRLYGKEVENFIQSYINYIIKSDFFVCFYTIFFVIFDEENIRVSFRNINLIPFNPEIIISKFDIKLYMLILTRSPSTEIDF